MGQTKHLALLRFFPICNIFPIIGQCRFFLTSGIGTDILMKVFEDYIIVLILLAWVLLNFIFSKNKGFWSEALLKMPLSSLFIKEFAQ